jgi:peptidyl-prolyl cis-trans isomerase B (cyclophilin B)
MTTAGIFVLQCGDPSGTGAGGPGYSFADELDGSETYGPGTLAMANAGPDTNGSQFFIVYADSPLPAAYAVFGAVDDAAVKTVEDVAKKGVDSETGDGAPNKEVTIQSVSVE